jgi:ABC-type cobalamin/Fe3+-siderophores transport system ATPase subunit
MTVSKPKLIGIVGPCGSGKSTLTQALDRLGYTTRHIAQEHSYVKDMWKRMTGPDILVYLHVSYAVSQARRPMNWTEADYQEQLRRLRHAREHADLIVDTDQLEVSQLVECVVAFIQG